jgi:hypothetical protein
MSEGEPTYQVDVKIQRGNSTDDRDTLKASVEAETLRELDRREEAMLTRLERLADKVRNIQPDDSTAQSIADGQATLDDQEADS